MEVFNLNDYVITPGDVEAVTAQGGAFPPPGRGPRGPRGPRPTPKPPEGVLRRNDTSFPAKSTAKLRDLYEQYLAARANAEDSAHGWASVLKYYQYLVRTVMSNPEYGIGADGNARGLLVYHSTGMGKTRLAVAVAMSLWDVRQPVVMLPRSLQKNFLGTVEEVVGILHAGAPPEALARMKAEAVARFTFVSMDAYNAADQMARAGTGAKRVKRGDVSGATGGLDNKLLVVDEAHNFFRAIINSSAENANARRLYDMIMTARNLRIVFLTGTPAAKDPFELVPCFNMLAGTDLLPTQYEIFYKLYVDRAGHRVRNRERLANRLVGLVSHVTPTRPSEPTGTRSGAAALAPKKPRDDGWYPEEKPTVVELVEMGPDQYRQYLLAREKEEAEGRGGEGAGGRGNAVMAAPPLALPGSEKKAMRSYYVKSRALSNFSAPREWAGSPIDRMPEEVFTAAVGPKLALIAERADKAPGPVLVYSQFVDAGGLKPLGRYLQRLGYAPFVPELPAKQRPAKGTTPSEKTADALATEEALAEEALAEEEAVSKALAEGGALGAEDDVPDGEYLVAPEDARLLEAEWAQYDLTHRIESHLTRGANKRKAYEARNALERWLLAGANRAALSAGGRAPWAIYTPLASAPDLATRLAADLAAKHVLPNEAEANRAVDEDLTLVRLATAAAPPARPDLRVTLHGGRLVCESGARRASFPLTFRTRALLRRARQAGKTPAGAVAAVARTALRYAAAAMGSQHWGLTQAHYAALYESGVRNEGFASPFNSRTVVIGRPDARFCSVFPDTDAIFGSLGSFFDADLPAVPGAWTANPPFIEDLMAKAAAHIEAALGRAKFTTTPLLVYCLLPVWDDSPAVRAFIDSPHAVHVERLRAGRYTLEAPDGKEFRPPFDCYYAALRSTPPDPAEKEEIVRLCQEPQTGPPADETGKPPPARGGADTPGAPPSTTKPLRKGYYAVISGEVPNEVRDAIKLAFNAPANAHGEGIKALLVSKTGAEGLDLKNIRETHQVEPYWDRARDDQVKARAVRIGSHDGLPRDERVVQPYLYVAVANQKIWSQMLERDREAETIDQQFAKRANERYETNAAFRQLLAEVCLECEIFGYGACRICVPTNAPLFHDDPALDVRLPDPCEVRQETDVKAAPIRVGGVTYYYVVDPSAPLGYTFFAYRDDLGGYAPLDPSDPLVASLLAAVEAD